MAKCDVCGNDYDKSFEVRMAGSTYIFDSFECAIHKLAPECEHCGCKIIGHGMESAGRMFCCAMCAEHEGVPEMVDRIPAEEGGSNQQSAISNQQSAIGNQQPTIGRS